MNATINLMKKYAATSVFTKVNIILLIACAIYSLWIPNMTSFGVIYITFYFCLAPFLEEETTKGNEQMICMPIKRAQIVISKYLCNSIVLLFLSFISLYSVYNSYGFDTKMGLMMLGINLCAPVLLLTFFLPLGLKFGMQVIRLIVIGSVFIFSLGSAFLLENLSSGAITLSLNFISPITLLAVVVISILLYMLSLQISIIIFNKREYR